MSPEWPESRLGDLNTHTPLLPQQDSAEGLGKEARRNSVHAVFQGTITSTRAWLQSVFRERIFYIISAETVLTFRYRDEIQVKLCWAETRPGGV